MVNMVVTRICLEIDKERKEGNVNYERFDPDQGYVGFTNTESSIQFPLQIRARSGSSDLLESENVIPIKIHRDQESGKILNLVFVWANEGSELKVDVSVVFKEESEEKQEALLVATASLFSLLFLCAWVDIYRMWKNELEGERWVRIRKRKDELQK
ncbi:uncharacterized protein [Malus domestica]|uniref:uncharacterized protein n=1 Tax=Malus domestica TaxID=3750 RepID=UPI003975A743